MNKSKELIAICEDLDNNLYHIAYLKDIPSISKTGLKASSNHYGDLAPKQSPLNKISNGKLGVSFSRNKIVNIRSNDLFGIIIVDRNKLISKGIKVEPVLSPRAPMKSRYYSEEVAFDNIDINIIKCIILPTDEELENVFNLILNEQGENWSDHYPTIEDFNKALDNSKIIRSSTFKYSKIWNRDKDSMISIYQDPKVKSIL
jgi:hypothetical protein